MVAINKAYRVDYVDPHGQSRFQTIWSSSGIRALKDFKEPHCRIKGVTEEVPLRGAVNDGMMYWSEPQWRTAESELARMRQQMQTQQNVFANQSVSAAMLGVANSLIGSGSSGGLGGW